MEIQEYVDIKNYSTFKIGGQFRYFAIVSTKEELLQIYAIAHSELKYINIPIFILGGGSNIVFSDGVLNIIALKIEIKGFKIINETHNYVDVKVGAGEIWDQIVEKTVAMNLSGLEALSAIPGTVGATPVQNVGAYGVEVKDTIVEVEVFDIKPASSHMEAGEEKKIKYISNQECKFGYRDSIFKNEAKGRYIITSVTYRLNKITSPKVLPAPYSRGLNYPGVLKYLETMEIDNPTLRQIRQAIIEIRKEKLPNPNETPNVGSFFKNPIISKDSFLAVSSALSRTYGQIPNFEVGNNEVKIPAGWLIENAGLKGKSFGNVSVYDKNALVLVNNGNATKDDLLKAKNEIIKIVQDKFGITLEQEPEII
ncbi:MAG: UDP-N-acetylmuramate dehydrogenase [Candidatus Paceibacterota bacterium]